MAHPYLYLKEVFEQMFSFTGSISLKNVPIPGHFIYFIQSTVQLTVDAVLYIYYMKTNEYYKIYQSRHSAGSIVAQMVKKVLIVKSY